jgi:hypothetical protein
MSKIWIIAHRDHPNATAQLGEDRLAEIALQYAGGGGVSQQGVAEAMAFSAQASSLAGDAQLAIPGTGFYLTLEQ